MRDTLAMAEVRYARSGDAHLAFQVLGDGPTDLLFDRSGSISIVDNDTEPRFARFVDRLGEFARVIRYDSRGVGLSDPDVGGPPRTLERDVADVVAVLDAANATSPTIFGEQAAGLGALMVAALHPSRVDRLVLWHSFARLERAPDYPFGVPPELLAFISDEVTDPEKATPTADLLRTYAPSVAEDPVFTAWWEEGGRRGASPAAARAQRLFDFQGDVRHILPQVQAPTLVLHRRESRWTRVEHSRYLAEHLPNARLIELDGADVPPFIGDSDTVIAEIEEFVTGERHAPMSDRLLATVMFTDIVGSTEEASRLGDERWRVILDRHDEMVRRQIERFGGREVKNTGDGFLATFAGPAHAVRCASSIGDVAAQLGLRVRVGVHTGEVEQRGDDIAGVAVHLGQRISSVAGPGEVLVSRTVKDLVTGSGIPFEDRGSHEFPGVEDAWQLFAVVR